MAGKKVVMPEPVVCHAWDLSIPVHTFATGWLTAVRRPTPVVTTSATLDVPRPAVLSVRIRPLPVATRSYTFPELPVGRQPAPGGAATPRAQVPPAARRTCTRIEPPRDIVKLQDRLYYLLQPPLESLVSSGQLALPAQPFPYQYQGIAFLYPRYAAILADEMGLGKTMQAITAARLLLRSGEIRSVLLICPKPLVSTWQREFAQWAPELPVSAIEGDQGRRHWQWQQTNPPVKIANYELLLRDADVLRSSAVHFDLVVLDEAQRIKNHASSTSQIVRAIRRGRSWALTGTPIENSSDDLVAIFEFLQPGYLQPSMRSRRIGQAARDYVLRRTKDAVLKDLPPKLFRDANLDLTPEQEHAYRQAEERGIIQLSALGEALTIQHVFELVLRLKQICNFDPLTGASSKLERLEADLDEVAASGKKAIVFSQWVQTIAALRKPLARFRPLEYHGRIPSPQRDGVIARFRDDAARPLLMMSYGAGSVGLNLQFCSYVFLFDRWWNPAVEDQAINRAHRIGAVGPVTVTRMLTLNTIEQRIEQVLEEKRQLAARVFSETGEPDSLGLTQQDIFGLFNLAAPAAGKRAA
ncbi:MAG: DEAD/DEAH box helicase [Pirellulaceae bacterium]|jgi:SNF2 family DNA or RNA helicase|nr:DEAD/DEAH box helicase [Pirellulaceae bacterium]